MSIGDCPYWPDCGHRGASGMRACDGTERDERMQAAFDQAMEGRRYGKEERRDAFTWFASGWYAAHRSARLPDDPRLVTGTGAPPPQWRMPVVVSEAVPPNTILAITEGKPPVVVRLEEHPGDDA